MREIVEDCINDMGREVVTCCFGLLKKKVFEFIVTEKSLPKLIEFCRLSQIDRYDFVDDLKDEMIEVILKNENLEDDIFDNLQIDKELLSIAYLVSCLNEEDKKTVLFNMTNKYPSLFAKIYSKVGKDVTELALLCLNQL